MSGALTLFLVAVLAVSSLHKMIARDRLATTTAKLARIAAPLGMPLLLVTATIEILAALALLIPTLRQGGALAAAGLWAVYGLALLSRRGQTLDCGCDLFSREKPVDGFAILRPWALAALAAWLAFSPVATWTLDAPFAALAFLALWFASGELAVLPHLARISRR
ncbi:MAG: hypothetical protein KGM49_00880 [Sphingomonadales bacterium]|nr:hypothetical protein [Sphingomonadales bacterium]